MAYNPHDFANKGKEQVFPDLSACNPQVTNIHPELVYNPPTAFPCFSPGLIFGDAHAGMASESNPMMQPQDTVVEQPPPLPLPAEEETYGPLLYSDSKQFQAILRRRERLKKISGPEEKLAEVRKRILKQSRMRVSNMRPRGEGGRFISQKDLAEHSAAANGNGGSNTPAAGPSKASASSNHASISTGVGMEGDNGVNG